MTTIPFPQFAPSARKRWEKVPDWAREKILETVRAGIGTPTPENNWRGGMCQNCQ